MCPSRRLAPPPFPIKWSTALYCAFWSFHSEYGQTCIKPRSIPSIVSESLRCEGCQVVGVNALCLNTQKRLIVVPSYSTFRGFSISKWVMNFPLLDHRQATMEQSEENGLDMDGYD